MASSEEAISSGDPEVIKKRRSTIQGMMTNNCKRLGNQLAKIGGKFDHDKIKRFSVQRDQADLERLLESFKKIHEAYLYHRKVGEDESEEKALVEKQEQHYDEVIDRIYESLELCAEYQESSKEALAQQLRQEEELQKQEAGAVTKAEEGRIKKELRARVVKSELDYKESVGKYRTAMKNAEEMTKFARPLSKEEVVGQVMQFAHVRSLPTDETKKRLVDRFEVATEAALRLRDAIEAESGIEDAVTRVTFDGVVEDESVQDMVSLLDLLLSAKLEYNGKGSGSSQPVSTKSTPIKVRLNTPKFSGRSRDFAIYKMEFMDVIVPGRSDPEIGALLREGLNTKEKNLLRNNDMADYREALDILQNEYGKPEMVISDVNADLNKLKPPIGEKADQGFINFVEKIENICRDMETVSRSGDLKNGHMIDILVRKLPAKVAQDWVEHKQKEKLGSMVSEDIFRELMDFLKAKKEVTKELLHKQESSVDKSKTHSSYVTGQSFTIQQQRASPRYPKNGDKRFGHAEPLCVACKGSKNPQDAKHWTTECEKWKNLKLPDRKRLVSCQRHMQAGDSHDMGRCQSWYMSKWYNNGISGLECGICKSGNHCAELCEHNKSVTKLHKVTTMTSRTEMLPVLLQASYVVSPGGVKLGTLWDLCSTDDYITFKKADEMGLDGREVVLTIEGVGGVETTINTKLYDVPVSMKRKRYGGSKQAVFQCYGMEKIAEAATPPEEASYKDLCDKFNLRMEDMIRPDEIDLLISMRRNRHHPKPVMTKGDMTLYRGQFGSVFGGTEPGLIFEPYILNGLVQARQQGCMYSKTLRAVVKSVTAVSSANVERELLNFFEDDSIGVDANPKCGSCQCGQCLVGEKPMSLKMEKLYRECKENLVYKPEGLPGDSGPFFQTTYQWDVPRENLVPNFPAVEAIRKRTLKKLEKDAEWHTMYDQQLQTLLDKSFARELDEGELESWKAGGGSYYYMAHQMVVVPTNKSTPIRVVFNSSQKFRGFSLNSSWNLGPDVMANLQATLLRFRNDVKGAQGDISKMFYMVRVTKEEEMMQLFVWKFKGEDKLRTFCMTRLVMGNKPSTNISIVAIQQSTELEDFHTIEPEACEVLNKDIYVDNVFVTAPDIETLLRIIKGVEKVAGAGGFKFKEWMIPGQVSDGEKLVSLQVYDDVEKALGLYWCLVNDEFFVKLEISDEDRKLLDLPDASLSPITNQLPRDIKPRLTLRICLRFHMKIFDPLGFVMPTKMIGNLLFRISLQVIKKEGKGRIPWDECLPEELLEDWLMYFGRLLRLESVKFARSFKPDGADPDVLPDLITFEDGNPDAFGAVAYALWTLRDGTKEVRLIMSKAKLAPIVKKGETVRNELNGAVFAARLKTWILKTSGIKFNKHVPILDSRIVQDMIKKDSYWYNTFAGVRVAEIQSKTNVDDWLHVPSNENIADILTRGAPPSELAQGSVWQNGPKWLVQDRSTWPVTEVRFSGPVDPEIEQFKTAEKKLSSSTFNVCVRAVDILETPGKVWTFSSDVAKKSEDNTAAKNVDANEKNHLKRFDLLELFGANDGRFSKLVARFSDLSKLIRVMAYIMRVALAKRRLRGTSAEGRTKVAKEITAQEYNDAWIVLIHLEQSARLQEKQVMKLVPKRIKVKLSMYDWVVDHLVIGGRVSNFPISYDGNYEVPIVPYGPLGRLIMLHYHDKHHREVDTVVAVARADVWVVKARKLAAEWDNKCKICLIKRQKLAGQVMGNLPSFRSEVKPAWTSVNMDLFGPYRIRDDCVKKGPRIYKKVWGVIFTCTLTRGVHLDVAMDYGTESVLHTIRRLMAVKGDVKLIISDPGSQLKGASKELISWRKDWDEQMLVRFGAKKGLDWLFIMPDSQHQNGAAEVMIKMVKGVRKAFLKSMGEQVLSLNEMSTMMAEISNLVNQRPIGVKPNTNTHPEFLSPNSLYLGRCSDRISSGPFQCAQMFNDDPKYARDRFQLVQAITNQFWKNWIKLYFPSLLLRHKWHTSRRNLKVDDICLLQDENAFRSEWRMAKVMEVYPDKTGTVRNVLVQVKPIQDGSSKYKPSQGYQVKRHVSKLLLLVPAEDQENVEKEDDVEVEKVILENDVEVERVILDEDDVCDAMAPSVSSSYNSPDVQKQDEAAKQDGEVDEEPGGNVTARRRSPRFGHTNA